MVEVLEWDYELIIGILFHEIGHVLLDKRKEDGF